MPWGIYCHPEVAFCGLTEAQATERGYDVETSVHRWGGNGRALIVGETDGMVKIVAERGGAILGVHIAGPWATELIAEAYLSVNWEATPADVGSADPRAPDALGAVRRVGARAHRPQPPRLSASAQEGTFVDVTMPQLGETVTEGTITRWFKQVGENVDGRRAAVRGVDRQGRLRGARARGRRASPRSSCRRATPSTSARASR